MRSIKKNVLHINEFGQNIILFPSAYYIDIFYATYNVKYVKDRQFVPWSQFLKSNNKLIVLSRTEAFHTEPSSVL